MKTEKYTKDKLIKMYIESNARMVEYVSHLDTTLKALNDNNILHTQTLSKNTEAVREMVKSNNRFMKLFSWILVVLTLAIVILAGAEKALKFIPNI